MSVCKIMDFSTDLLLEQFKSRVFRREILEMDGAAQIPIML